MRSSKVGLRFFLLIFVGLIIILFIVLILTMSTAKPFHAVESTSDYRDNDAGVEKA